MCKFCGFSAERQDLDAAISTLIGCINCRADIATCGDWNGEGYAGLHSLIEKYGKHLVSAAYAKYEKAKNKPQKSRKGK
jgi:hypothetical protein